MSSENDLTPKPTTEAIAAPDGSMIILPAPPKQTRWLDAEKDPSHQAIFEKHRTACSCGWEGQSWITHYQQEKKEG